MKKQLILPSKRLRSEILMKIEDIASFLAAISDKKGNETILNQDYFRGMQALHCSFSIIPDLKKILVLQMWL